MSNLKDKQDVKEEIKPTVAKNATDLQRFKLEKLMKNFVSSITIY